MIANSKTLDTLRQHPIATVLETIYVVLAVVTSHPLATTPSEVLPASNKHRGPIEAVKLLVEIEAG